MKPAPFESTPAFANFKDQMRKLIQVPKSELDELIEKAKTDSPRFGNPSSPGRKSSPRRKRSRKM